MSKAEDALMEDEKTAKIVNKMISAAVKADRRRITDAVKEFKAEFIEEAEDTKTSHAGQKCIAQLNRIIRDTVPVEA